MCYVFDKKTMRDQKLNTEEIKQKAEENKTREDRDENSGRNRSCRYKD